MIPVGSEFGNHWRGCSREGEGTWRRAQVRLLNEGRAHTHLFATCHSTHNNPNVFEAAARRSASFHMPSVHKLSFTIHTH